MEHNINRITGQPDPFGHFNIITAGLQVATGMVVGQHQGGGIVLQCFADDFTGENGTAGQRALEQDLAADETVVTIQVHYRQKLTGRISGQLLQKVAGNRHTVVKLVPGFQAEAPGVFLS